MKQLSCYTLVVLTLWFIALPLGAQTIDRKLLVWEKKVIDIGPVLEENGLVSTTFYGVNLHVDSIYITEVITDCGCTAADYSRETLITDKIADLHVRFDPDHRGGVFSKAIIVRTNMDSVGDTLYLEGINLPLPENPELAYPYRKGPIGFRLPTVHMGNVFTNTPKTKFVEVFNFGSNSISMTVEQLELPDHVYLALLPEMIPPNNRGLLQLVYDGDKKSDLGYFEENISLVVSVNEAPIDLKLTAVVFEYFGPITKSMESIVPRMLLSEMEIDLKEINANKKVSKSLFVDNLGGEDLIIRKVVANCECLRIHLSDKSLAPSQRGSLEFEFDPKGRRGIDHKHITIFSNDPINPVRTITIKSKIK
jgi:hypothetical protein